MTDSSGAAAASAPVGKLRWMILAILFVVTMINYADRATMSLAAPAMSKELGIDPLELGFVFSAFGWSYVIAQVPGGWLLDRFGVRHVYLWAIMLWSMFTWMQGAVVWLSGASAIAFLFVLRLLVGAAEAPSFPGNARLVASWFAPAERGTATAVFTSAQYFASVLFGPIMGLIVAQWGWPWVFVFMGVVGIAAAGVWRLMIHEPRNHPWLGAAELAHITREEPETVSDTAVPASTGGAMVLELLARRSLWGLYLHQFCVNALTYFFITWFPVYLIQERGMSVVEAGLVTVVPSVGGFVGGLLGGLWSDWLLRRGHSLTLARKLPIATGMLLSLTIVGCNFVDSQQAVVALMTLAFFGKGFGALGWAVMADIAPRRAAGLSGGIFNTFGNLSSIVTPILIGFILQQTGSFELVLVFLSACGLTAAVSIVALFGKVVRYE